MSLLMMLRHLAAILLLPFVVTVILPALLLRAPGDSTWAGGGAVVLLARVGGAAAFGIGAGVFMWCVTLFARVGRGTLAPWDPTGSWRVAVWTGAFVLINHAYFLAVEEPGLRQRFGERYQSYAAQVPRWLPRPGLRRTGRPERG